MGFKDITEGEKIAKPIGIRLVENKDGDKHALEVGFEFEEPSTGNPERLYRQFWLSEDAIGYSMDTLVNVLGFNRDAAEADMEGKDVLKYDNDVKLVIELEEYEGKSRPKIKYVNRLGGSAFAKLDGESTKTVMKDPRIKAAFAAAMQQDGAKKEDKKDVKNHAPQGTKKKLPF